MTLISKGIKANAVASIPEGFKGILIDDLTNEVVFFDSDGIITTISSGGVSSKSLKLTLTSAEILDFNATPIEIIPAPGVGKIIQIEDVTARLRFNSTSYATRDKIEFVFAGGGFSAASINVLITDNTVIRYGKLITSVNANDEQVVENTSLSLTNLSGSPTLGDSDVDVYIKFNIITL